MRSLNCPATSCISEGPGDLPHVVLDASNRAEPIDLLQLPPIDDDDMESSGCSLILVQFAVLVFRAKKLLEYEHRDPNDLFGHQVP